MWQPFLMIFICFVSGVFCEYGVLIVENESETEKFCVSFALSRTKFSTNFDDAKPSPLVDMSSVDGCDDPLSNISAVKKLKNAVAVLNQGNCSIAQKALVMSRMGAAGILIIDHNGVPEMYEYSPVDNFTISVISSDSFERIQAMGSTLVVRQFVPPKRFYWDYAYLIIWLIAVTSVFLGGIWTQAARARVEKSEFQLESNRRNDASADDEAESPQKVPSTRIMMCAVGIYSAWGLFFFGYVVLNYYFFQYMVYVDIALFSVAATIGLYWCFLPFVRRIPMGKDSLSYMCCTSLEIGESIWFMVCVALTIIWCVCIRKSWVWALQNVLGMSLCISLLGVWRNSSLKNCTVILVILFVYDVFMVFITPLFTHDGKSIMERMVIGGGETRNSLLMVPSVFQSPFLSTSPMAFCSEGYLILGFGDIIVPGILISYCYDFGVKNKIPHVYFIASMIGYGFGLLLTGIFINVMQVMQPALLYLVPCCLLPVFTIALVRKEFRCIWHNNPVGYKLFDHNGDYEL